MNTPVKYKTAEEALSIIESGNRIFVHGSAQTPNSLLKASATHTNRLRDVELVFITVNVDIEVDKAEYADHFNLNSLFVSASVRGAVNEGRADYVPVFLSEIPELFTQDILPLDVALVQVSPPDSH